MKSFECICRNCGARLELDIDKMSTICPYCDSEIILDAKALAGILKEREKTKRQINDNESKERTAKVALEYEHKKHLLAALAIIAFIAIIFVIVILGANTSKTTIPFSQEYAHGKQYSLLLTSLDNAGFENVSIIPCSENEYSASYQDGQVIEVTINGESDYSTKKKVKADKTNIIIKFYSYDGNLSLPISSKGITGSNVKDIESLLKKYGFKNIVAEEQGGIFSGIVHDNWEIIDIQIDGKSKFKQGDRFSPDATIFIKYYYR